MPVSHHSIIISTHGQSTYEFTRELQSAFKKCEQRNGVVTVYCMHTSCSLLIMENADPSVRYDLQHFIEKWIPENDPDYTHTFEGADDMPAHIKTAFSRTSESIPYIDGQLMLGTWQGLYLWEHRAHPHKRKIIFSFIGE